MVEAVREWVNTSRGWVALAITAGGLLIGIGMWCGRMSSDIAHLQRRVDRLEARP